MVTWHHTTQHGMTQACCAPLQACSALACEARMAVGQDSLNNPDSQSTQQGVLLVLQVFNEGASPYYEANAAAAADALAEMTENDRVEANKKYSINGFLFCNVPGMNMTVGDR